MRSSTPSSPRPVADLIARGAEVVVTLVARIAPRNRRADWLREWRAEIWHRREALRRLDDWTPRSAIALLYRSLGTIPHALWLRAHVWSPDMLLQDLRFSLRSLARAPGFAAVTVLTLALGIGANTAIFSVLDAVVLRPLAFADAGRLVALWSTDRRSDPPNRGMMSYPDLADYVERASTLETLGAWSYQPSRLATGTADPVTIGVNLVGHELIDLLGIRPVIGRAFTDDDDRVGADLVAMITTRTWESRFDADPAIVGRVIRVDDSEYVVVGVVPSDYAGGEVDGRVLPASGSEVWIALRPNLESIEVRGVHNLRPVGRLTEGVGMAAASEELAGIADDLTALYPEDNAEVAVWVEPLHRAVTGRVRPLLMVLLGCVGLVLLIACTNVANLLLSRGSARASEMAIRAALGAPRSRLTRQLIVESLVLSLTGAALGLVFARLGAGLMVSLSPTFLPRSENLALDARVLIFTVLVATLTGLLFGLVPSLRASAPDLRAGLHTGGRGSSGTDGRRLRQVLVVSEIAVAVVLVVAAGLLVRSFRELTEVDPGFDGDDVVIVELARAVPFIDPNWPETVAFFAEVVERTRLLPGVTAAAAAYHHPLAPGWTSSFTREDLPPPAAGTAPEYNIRPVTPGYFATIGTPVLAGREFEPGDDASSRGVAVVNRALADRLFAGENPLGRRLLKSQWWQSMDGSWEIVGVVDDVRFGGLHTPPEPAVYLPHAQWPFVTMSLVIRSAGDVGPVLDGVRGIVADLDPGMPVDVLGTVDELLTGQVAQPRFQMILIGSFALLAAALAAIGIYGVLSYLVARRRRELGIRMALGAEQARVVGSVLAEAGRLAGAGILLGLGAAAALRGLVEGFLYGVSPFDPLTFGGVALAVAAIALLAAFLPAWRASRVAPAAVLQDD